MKNTKCGSDDIQTPARGGNYFFIPGRIPSLSLRELFEVCRSKGIPLSFDATGRTVFLATLPGTADTQTIFAFLGGMIKYGKCLASHASLDAALLFISEQMKEVADYSKKRITFGISSYTISQGGRKEHSRDLAFSLQRWGITLKKELVSAGASVRFVVSQKGEAALSSVVVEKNHLCEGENAEWVIIHAGDGWYVGKTNDVQEFEEFSHRDWNRPHRDMQVGLLPPKIARMMVNLSGVGPDANMLDPFCGLGTVLQEAILLGHTHIFGSDLEQKQVDATKENLDWLFKAEVNLDPRLRGDDNATTVKQCDARTISHCFPKQIFDAIVTEPYLGPIMNQSATHTDPMAMKELCALYVASFREWKHVLKKNGRVVVVFPVWIFRDKKIFLPCLEEIQTLGYKNITAPPELATLMVEKTDRSSILIAREGQHVGRELFVFEKA